MLFQHVRIPFLKRKEKETHSLVRDQSCGSDRADARDQSLPRPRLNLFFKRMPWRFDQTHERKEELAIRPLVALLFHEVLIDEPSRIPGQWLIWLMASLMLASNQSLIGQESIPFSRSFLPKILSLKRRKGETLGKEKDWERDYGRSFKQKKRRRNAFKRFKMNFRLLLFLLFDRPIFLFK